MYGGTFILKENVDGSNYVKDRSGIRLEAHNLRKGTKVKVVMVSRFGDCGITDDLTKEAGYCARVMPEQLREDIMSKIHFHLGNQWCFFKWFLTQMKCNVKDYWEMVRLDLKCLHTR